MENHILNQVISNFYAGEWINGQKYGMGIYKYANCGMYERAFKFNLKDRQVSLKKGQKMEMKNKSLKIKTSIQENLKKTKQMEGEIQNITIGKFMIKSNFGQIVRNVEEWSSYLCRYDLQK
ncbi:unnamed protein product [Paramecium sonneborni]|uniref:Uncharacterized protein n=1 Tax=Paramecium sonneborni TaxID=65129 RepID=A0A8S1K8Q8_9CILI|nr:unnamed protein product [Paramecium sonneborni]